MRSRCASGGQRNGRRQKRQPAGGIIVLVDESGLSTKPKRVRTWAPLGETPLLLESFNWRSLSIIGRLSLRRFNVQIHRGSTKSAQVIDFIKHLQHHLKRRILIIWDGVAIHRSKAVQANIVTTKGKVQAERLLPYALEINTVESMRAHLKSHETGKLIANQAWG